MRCLHTLTLTSMRYSIANHSRPCKRVGARVWVTLHRIILRSSSSVVSSLLTLFRCDNKRELYFCLTRQTCMPSALIWTLLTCCAKQVSAHAASALTWQQRLGEWSSTPRDFTTGANFSLRHIHQGFVTYYYPSTLVQYDFSLPELQWSHSKNLELPLWCCCWLSNFISRMWSSRVLVKS